VKWCRCPLVWSEPSQLLGSKMNVPLAWACSGCTEEKGITCRRSSTLSTWSSRRPAICTTCLLSSLAKSLQTQKCSWYDTGCVLPFQNSLWTLLHYTVVLPFGWMCFPFQPFRLLRWYFLSAVKSTGCSSRGPEFNSQQPHGGSQPPVMRSDVLFWCVWRQRQCT